MISIRNIVEKYTAEMALFVLLCRVAFRRTNAAEVVGFLSDYKIDWDVFSRIIATHQLRPIIYRVLSTVSEHIDPQFLSHLKQDTLKIASGNLVRLDEMLKIHSALVEAGIANIPYKGVLLSQFLYGDFVTRETGDIDIMIRAKDISRAYNVMSACGYKPAHSIDLAFVDRFIKTESELMFVKHLASRLVKVEIHWEVTHDMMDVRVSVEQLFINAKGQVLLGKPVQTLDVKDLLVILMTHHGVNDVWRTFRHVADIAAFLEKDETVLSAPQMSNRFVDVGLSKTSAIGVQLCYDLFGVGAASPIQSTREYRAILHELLNFSPLDRNKLSAGNIRRQFRLRDSFADKLRLALGYVKVAFTPNVRDVETVRLPRSLHFLYYFLKPFLFLARRK